MTPDSVVASQLCCSYPSRSLVHVPCAPHTQLYWAQQAFGASRVLTMMIPLLGMPFPYISPENSYVFYKTQLRSRLLQEVLHEHSPLYALWYVAITSFIRDESTQGSTPRIVLFSHHGHRGLMVTPRLVWLLAPGPCAKHHTLTIELLSHFTDQQGEAQRDEPVGPRGLTGGAEPDYLEDSSIWVSATSRGGDSLMDLLAG